MDRLERTYVELLRSQRSPAGFASLASDFRNEERHLAAGLVSLAGYRFGGADNSFTTQCVLLCDTLADLLRYLDSVPPTSWEKLLALWLLADNCRGYLFTAEAAVAVDAIRRNALGHYYDTLHEIADGSPNADSLLISGFKLQGLLDSGWTFVSTEYEVTSGGLFRSRSVPQLQEMIGGFRVLLELADYDGASKLARGYDHALTNPVLRGWSFASEGLSTESVEKLSDAAAQFELDAMDRPGRNPAEPWTSINQTMWAPYFRSRSMLGQSVTSPHEALQSIQAAALSLPRYRDWFIPEILAYTHIVLCLNSLHDGDVARITRVIASYRRDAQFFSAWNGSHHIDDFLTAIGSMAQVRTGDHWVPQLLQLIRILDRIPIISRSESIVVQNALSAIIPDSLEGMGRGWEYRALASIKDERQLHRILLALFRAEFRVPLYSQIRHGPLEYGKDIVICRDEAGSSTLWMYSVKVGPIKKSNWNREIRPQLEEMFQVPLDSPGLPGNIDTRVGILVWNDHVQPHADPIVNGWLREQADFFRRRFELMNIDRLVGYISDNHLGPTLRKALRAEGLLP